MPVISIDIGEVSVEQKQALIQEMTVKAAEITNIPKEAFVVVVREVPDNAIGVGGKTVEQTKREFREKNR
jgi:4-oxalocrotonate tautomerase